MRRSSRSSAVVDIVSFCMSFFFSVAIARAAGGDGPAAVPRAIPVRAGGYVCANYSRFYCNVEEAESLHGKYMASYIETA